MLRDLNRNSLFSSHNEVRYMKRTLSFCRKCVVGIMLLLLIIPGMMNAQDSTRLFDKSNRHTLYAATLSSTVLFTGAFLADKPIRTWAKLNHTVTGDAVNRYSNYLGDKRVVLSLNAALLGTGYLIDDPDLKKTSWNAARSILSTALITEGLKYTFGRSRPYTENG